MTEWRPTRHPDADRESENGMPELLRLAGLLRVIDGLSLLANPDGWARRWSRVLDGITHQRLFMGLTALTEIALGVALLTRGRHHRRGGRPW